METKINQEALPEMKTINGEEIFGSGDITIETETITEDTVTEWGFTKNTGTYTKPSSGIPASDLTSSVQSSLDNADSAVQSDGTVASIVAVSSMPSSPAANTLYVVI